MPYNRTMLAPAPYVYTGMNARQTAILMLSLLSLQLIAMGIMHDFARILIDFAMPLLSFCFYICKK